MARRHGSEVNEPQFRFVPAARDPAKHSTAMAVNAIPHDLANEAADLLKAFCEYRWPGNIRQLSHVIEQSYVLDSAPILPRTILQPRQEQSLPFTDLAQLRQTAVRQAMRSTRGHKGRAAKLLGVHPNTMTRLLVRLDHDSRASD